MIPKTEIAPLSASTLQSVIVSRLLTPEEELALGERKRDADVSGGSFVSVHRDAQMILSGVQLHAVPLTVIQPGTCRSTQTGQVTPTNTEVSRNVKVLLRVSEASEAKSLELFRPEVILNCFIQMSLKGSKTTTGPTCAELQQASSRLVDLQVESGLSQVHPDGALLLLREVKGHQQPLPVPRAELQRYGDDPR